MTNSEDYQRGLELAESGDHQQALICIQRHLQTAPDDVEALNDAGAILHCLGRSAEAIEHLEKAGRLQGGSPEITWNLAEAYLAAGAADKALGLFEQMELQGILHPDIVNRTANVFLKQDNKAEAVEALLCSLRLWPDQQVLAPMLNVVRTTRPKIAFFCGGDGTAFLEDIVQFTEKRFPVRLFEGETEKELYELMRWSDISWFEWCTNLAVIGSNLPKVCKTIIRLHRYEAYERWPRQVNWDNIDVLVTVGNSFVKEALAATAGDIESKTSMVSISNGVNLDKFKFINRPRGKNIAFLANLRMVKNPAMLLQCMQKLHYIDPGYRLFIAGQSADPALRQYLTHMVEVLELHDVVFFDGQQSDVNVWLEDKHYIVSTSIIESQGMGVLEAMACGIKPVIHNFPGAAEIFPPEFLFNIAEQFCEQICHGPYEPHKYRKFIEENHSLASRLEEVNRLFRRLEVEIEAEKTESSLSPRP